MARHVFFSFDYNYVWNVNRIRSMPTVLGTAAAGFQDASIWEEAKKKGDKTIKAMIDQALYNTTVTVVCTSSGTPTRKYINYEIDQSLDRGNGLVGVQIHHLKDQNGNTAHVGLAPSQITANGFQTYRYLNADTLAQWIEESAKIAGK